MTMSTAGASRVRQEPKQLLGMPYDAAIISALMVSRLSCFTIGLVAVLILIRPFEAQRGAGIAGGPGGALTRGAADNNINNTTTTVSVQPPPLFDFDTV